MLSMGKALRAWPVAAGIALQADAFKASTTAADRIATDQYTHRHSQYGDTHDEKSQQEKCHDISCLR
jgi:hypothetical protein